MIRVRSSNIQTLHMNIVRLLSILAVCGTLAGCATSGPDPLPPEPAARVSLQPEYRLFYDALVDYGDWILIEPYGYVFRPRVDFLTWRPYTNGYWVASDSYGWVWVSAETFGWATEHYGRWIWDDYQGYVWVPGVDWGPAWVSWQAGGPWVGWAAMSPSGMPVTGSRLPNGSSFVFAPVQNLGLANVATSLVTRDALGSAATAMRPVVNPGERDGVRFNRGPSISEIERVQGRTLERARLEDVLPARTVGRPVNGTAATSPDSLYLPSPTTVKNAGDDAARFGREVKGKDAPAPDRVPLIRPFLDKNAPAALRGRAPVSHSPADTSRAGRK